MFDPFGPHLGSQDPLLRSPVLDKRQRPKGRWQGEDERVRRQEEVGDDREDRKRDQAECVGRQEGEVESNRGSELLSREGSRGSARSRSPCRSKGDVRTYVSKEEARIGVLKTKSDLPILLGPLLDPLLVDGLVVKGEDRRDVCPGIRVGSQADTTLSKGCTSTSQRVIQRYLIQF